MSRRQHHVCKGYTGVTHHKQPVQPRDANKAKVVAAGLAAIQQLDVAIAVAAFGTDEDDYEYRPTTSQSNRIQQ